LEALSETYQSQDTNDIRFQLYAVDAKDGLTLRPLHLEGQKEITDDEHALHWLKLAGLNLRENHPSTHLC